MGILPFNCIFGKIKINSPIVLITLLRIMRVLSVGKILFLFEKFEVFLKNLNVLIIVIKAIMILFLLLHWTTCAWGFLNVRIEGNYYETTWFKTMRFEEDDKSIGL
jgi:hypothetical protein